MSSKSIEIGIVNVTPCLVGAGKTGVNCRHERGNLLSWCPYFALAPDLPLDRENWDAVLPDHEESLLLDTEESQ